MWKILILFVVLFFGQDIQSDSTIFSKNDFSKLSLIHYDEILKVDNEFYFGVVINLSSGWKTYWKNPGDSGETISLDFLEKTNIKDYEILYPAPKRYIDSEIETIGYENQVVFPIKLSLNEKKMFTRSFGRLFMIFIQNCIHHKTSNHAIKD